jgi:hypothetical protein
MKQVIWQKQVGQRGRLPWALVVHNGAVHPFVGMDIPGICVVLGQSLEKKGRWTKTTYRLAIPHAARFISGHEGWGTGTFLEGLQTALSPYPPIERWMDVANALGVSIPAAKCFLHDFRREEANRLDDVEAALAVLMEGEEDHDGDIEEVTFTFGAPTRRQMEAGYWGAPVLILLHDQEVGRVTPGGGSAGWTTPVTHGRVVVLSATHSEGHHGGYISLRLRVPEEAQVRKATSV